MNTREILITNDDGYFAPGINALAEELRKIAHVTIIAPDRERSAVGHALTFFHPLRVDKISVEESLTIYSTDGTPTDCVLIGVHQLLCRKPDLVVSGINRGSNLGDDITYSGTVAGAMEGALQDVPSMAVSLNSIDEFDYRPAARFAASLAKELMEKGLPAGVFLNVNYPALPPEEVRGVEITRQGRSIYKQEIVKRVDPKGRDYFWVTGARPDGEPIEGTDFWALKNGCISITPLHLSMTSLEYIDRLKEWEIINNHV